MTEENTEVPVAKKVDAPAAVQGRDLLTSLHGEADRLFREFTNRWPGAAFGMGRALPAEPLGGLSSIWSGGSPAIDVVDLDDKIEVRAELPGIAQEDIEIEVDDGRISIKAHKHEEKEEGAKESRYYLSERRYGSYSRTLQLPEGIDPDATAATFNNGVLTVSFPKTEEAKKKPKKIAIQNG